MSQQQRCPGAILGIVHLLPGACFERKMVSLGDFRVTGSR